MFLLYPNQKKVFLCRRIEAWHEQNGEIGRVIANTFSQRQASLIKRCQQFSKANNRIFIITGADHATSHASDNQFFKDGVKLLHNYLKKKRFAIFDNNRSPTKLLKADVKLGLMMSSVAKTVNKICGYALKIFFFLISPISFAFYKLYARI
jgi:hypothetical protein